MCKQVAIVARNIEALRLQVYQWQDAHEQIALVPTMGALHEGHMSLVRKAKQLSDRVCVSIFVNPTQFESNEDLRTYPRCEEKDIASLHSEGADLIYIPSTLEMYPKGDITRIQLQPMGDCLEGLYRPDFFTSVATIVAKLLMQASPHVAIFGEKDFQQLQIIRQMVRDLCLPVKIKGVPIVRGSGGLALSSRNSLLTLQEQRIATNLYKSLILIHKHVSAGGRADTIIDQEKERLIKKGFYSIDYLTFRDSASLKEVNTQEALQGHEGRILAAATIGNVRLIDNLAI